MNYEARLLYELHDLTTQGRLDAERPSQHLLAAHHATSSRWF
jgi:hypothetical protein